MVEPSLSDFVLAYATLTSTSFGASLFSQRPDVSWSFVTRPTFGVSGSIPAAVYGWLVMSVDGGFTSGWMVCGGVVNCASNCLKRSGRQFLEGGVVAEAAATAGRFRSGACPAGHTGP